MRRRSAYAPLHFELGQWRADSERKVLGVFGARGGGGKEPKPKSNCWQVMETPRYHLQQAEHCLELARLMSDPHSAHILRSAAGRHFEQASELEKLTVTSPSIAPDK
jgi:hypothetical protein